MNANPQQVATARKVASLVLVLVMVVSLGAIAYLGWNRASTSPVAGHQALQIADQNATFTVHRDGQLHCSGADLTPCTPFAPGDEIRVHSTVRMEVAGVDARLELSIDEVDQELSPRIEHDADLGPDGASGTWLLTPAHDGGEFSASVVLTVPERFSSIDVGGIQWWATQI